MKQYDVVVIGAGAGGLTAAYTALGFSKKVALIDKNKPGGECTWSGCVPSKALINIAEEIHMAKKFNLNLKIDSTEVMERVTKVIENVYSNENPEKLINDGIDYINGFARFIDKNTIEVNNEQIKAKKIIIATGSSPLVPPINGLDKVDYLTNESIFTLKKLPESLIVLGGGPIGIELAQALNRIGVKVKVIEMLPKILFREEPELVSMLHDRLESEGIEIYTGTKAIEVNSDNGKVSVKVQKNEEEFEIEGESILLALGRKANLEGLDLNKVGIEISRKGIEVDNHLETSLKGVYAIGDVVGPYNFSHMANVQGITAVQNAVLPINKKINYQNVAWCSYTDPELARAGMLETEAREKFGDSIRVYTHSYDHIDRAMTKENSIGLVKVILDKKGKVLGASILGDRAGEIISEIQVVKTLGVNFGKLADVIHPYPTYAEVLNKIGKKVKVDNLLNNPIVKLFRK
ncbi:dihydrolipoyl dehydrogenase family protein [Clostridium grantii]|uniref:Pyruvate/2-oxoglutarate dehydrogenase complex, dihydrolipoamide dehydrogenase (E3) component n=1 Tax=Clostridium grantii DSM 8605 TaxID=1121316 RepID=A0A1M5V3Y3_9CLOT|nr:FAD-dependent oxidoreductase [Clostridium grantii]SHH69969.1 Pyruvate/2-oxoglutarate dehydrogenase complex, dihydrolipoamide dehydrogenase (E3) component [Clostridium grantii DSM 8605]